jgi:hypothetical protein
MYTRKAYATREAQGEVSDDQRDARKGQAGRLGVTEGFVIPLKQGIRRCTLFCGVEGGVWRVLVDQ